MKTSFPFAALLTAALPIAAVACSDDPPVVDNSNNKVLEEVEITAANGEDTTVKEGTTQKLIAMAKYADDTSKDVSTDPGTVWTSSDPSNATVDKTGLVTLIDEGTVTITVTYNGKTETENLIIVP